MIHPEKSPFTPSNTPTRCTSINKIRTSSLLISLFPQRLIPLSSSILCSAHVLCSGVYHITSRENDKKIAFKDELVIV